MTGVSLKRLRRIVASVASEAFHDMDCDSDSYSEILASELAWLNCLGRTSSRTSLSTSPRPDSFAVVQQHCF